MTRGGGGGRGRYREEKVEGYDPLGSSLMLLDMTTSNEQ